MAGPNVEFLGACSDADVRQLYRGAAAMLLPGEEDFGIAPVEAQACGRPVVALGCGGALETIVDGVTGVLVTDPSPEAFAAGMTRACETRFDAVAIREHALQFDRSSFIAGIQSAIDNLMATPMADRGAHGQAA